jgi:hypothetical protein
VAPEKAEAAAAVVLRDTTALGVRMTDLRRLVLARRIETVRVGQETVAVKVAELGQGAEKASPEFADCKRIAEQTGRPVREVMESAMAAFRAQGGPVKRSRRAR